MMRLFSLLLISGSILSCTNNQKATITPIGQFYGEPFSLDSVTAVDEIDRLMQGKDSLLLTLEGSINKTCAAKGCWMQIENEDSTFLRVKFKDYGFFVPKSGVEGKTASFKGYCQKSTTSIEELRHYAKDAGESEEVIASIIAPKQEYSFIATGVYIEQE